MSAATLSFRPYTYAPVSPAHAWAHRAASGPRRLLAAWVLLLVPIAASGLLTLWWRVTDFTVGEVTVYVTPFLPIVCATLLALWFGYAWGAVPLFLAQLTLGLTGGLGGWAFAFALSGPLGLGVLIVAYQAAPVSTTLRSMGAATFFAVGAFVAALTASAGAFVWAHAVHLDALTTLAAWQGSWVGALLASLFLTAPVLVLFGPTVEAWKRRADLGAERPETLPPGRLAFAFTVVLFAFASYVLLVRYFGWESLGPVDDLAPNVVVAVEQLSMLQWMTFLFIALTAWFGYQVARGWTATASALADANRALQETLDERDRDQERLVAYAQEQEQASRAKDLFFSIISHDLRGPMGALLGLAEVAENRLDRHADEDLVEMASLMHRSAEGLYGLLINLLEWSRLQTGQMQPSPSWVDLHALTEAAVQVHAAHAAEKGVWLKNCVAPGTTVWADQTMLRSVLLNLIGNGLKFTEGGGSVTVRAVLGDGRVEVSVDDTGVGMSAEDVARLFRVEQTRSRTGTAGERGSGLGLVLCREMIERHGGRIVATSEKGTGSRFRFALPLAPKDARARTSALAAAE